MPEQRGQAGRGEGAQGQAHATAGACLDLARAAAAGDGSAVFPRNCVALDSWANVWLKHDKSMPEAYFQGVLQLAYGECLCHKDV